MKSTGWYKRVSSPPGAWVKPSPAKAATGKECKGQKKVKIKKSKEEEMEEMENTEPHNGEIKNSKQLWNSTTTLPLTLCFLVKLLINLCCALSCKNVFPCTSLLVCHSCIESCLSEKGANVRLNLLRNGLACAVCID